jgi:hypothetical protein
VHFKAYGRSAASAAERQTQKHRQRLWDLLHDKIAIEHRALEARDPGSPRIKPSVGTVGWVLR